MTLIFCNFTRKKLEMELLEVEILNPKAKKLLNELAAKKLIYIRPANKKAFDLDKFLERIRSKDSPPISDEEIIAEVKAVRMARRVGK